MLKSTRALSLRLKWTAALIIFIFTVQAVTTQEITPEPTPSPFSIGNDLTIVALRTLDIESSDLIIEEALPDGQNYARYIASYLSEGFKVYGLLTIPFGEIPEGGFKAVVFNHGYIPPTAYVTTERYVAYVDALASAGFVVFKIDLRGHGNSEGEPIGSYFSPTYTIDALSALYALQQTNFVDPDGIGMWGHSMAGNLVLRAMLVEPDIQAGVIWAGAVYSYDDFARYAITDPSFVRSEQSPGTRRSSEIFAAYGRPDLAEPFWQAVSLTLNIDLLSRPVQLHHAVNDDVVNIGYSRELAAVLLNSGKAFELYEYDGGGHNISSPFFEEAMRRTITFFLAHL